MGKKDKKSKKPNLTIVVKGVKKTGKSIVAWTLARFLQTLGFDVEMDGVDTFPTGATPEDLSRALAGRASRIRLREKTKAKK